MKFLVVTHVRHKLFNGRYYAYGPYVREMNLWFKHVEEVIVVAPIEKGVADPIDLPYEAEHIEFIPVPALSFTTPSAALKSLFALPGVLWKIICAMKNADHIHLRCPGNMGVLGALVQLLFPRKKKRPNTLEIGTGIVSNLGVTGCSS